MSNWVKLWLRTKSSLVLVNNIAPLLYRENKQNIWACQVTKHPEKQGCNPNNTVESHRIPSEMKPESEKKKEITRCYFRLASDSQIDVKWITKSKHTMWRDIDKTEALKMNAEEWRSGPLHNLISFWKCFFFSVVCGPILEVNKA